MFSKYIASSADWKYQKSRNKDVLICCAFPQVWEWDQALSIWNILTVEKILTTPFSTQGQHYEEEKRALSHEIIALNNHLIEAKVTIDKLSEDNVSI